MPSILIMIPSFDNKHTINVIVYIRFDIYVQFQRKEREECHGGVSLAGTVSMDRGGTTLGQRGAMTPQFFYNYIIYYIILNIYFKNLMFLILYIYIYIYMIF